MLNFFFSPFSLSAELWHGVTAASWTKHPWVWIEVFRCRLFPYLGRQQQQGSGLRRPAPEPGTRNPPRMQQNRPQQERNRAAGCEARRAGDHGSTSLEDRGNAAWWRHHGKETGHIFALVSHSTADAMGVRAALGSCGHLCSAAVYATPRLGLLHEMGGDRQRVSIRHSPSGVWHHT